MNRSNCLTQVWDQIIRFNEKYYPNWRLSNEVELSNALAGEVGEVCNMVKHRIGGGTKNDPTISDYELLKELADVFIYIQLMVETRGHDITTFAEVTMDKIEENHKRMMDRIDAENSPPK